MDTTYRKVTTLESSYLNHGTFGLAALDTDLGTIITDVATVDTNVDALLVDTGDGGDAETSAGATGSLHSKLRGLLVDAGDGTDAETSAGNAGSLHSKLRGILVDLGDGTDAVTAAGDAGSLHSKTRAILTSRWWTRTSMRSSLTRAMGRMLKQQRALWARCTVSSMP